MWNQGFKNPTEEFKVLGIPFFFYLEPPPEPPMSCKYGFEDGAK